MYFIFAGKFHYPRGGWDDYKMWTVTLNEAYDEARALQGSVDWWQIVSSKSLTVLDQWNNPNA